VNRWHAPTPAPAPGRPGALTPCLALILLATGLSGCTAAAKSPAEQLTVNVGLTSTDRRAVYFELTAKGELLYAVGPNASPDAQLRSAGMLTLPERQKLLDIVDRYQLTQAKGAGIFSSGSKTTYRLAIHTADGTHRFTALDEEVPGVRELYDAIFNLYTARMYPIGTMP
jgi:hypothetical protein